jgi:hypothetical protein
LTTALGLDSFVLYYVAAAALLLSLASVWHARSIKTTPEERKTNYLVSGKRAVVFWAIFLYAASTSLWILLTFGRGGVTIGLLVPGSSAVVASLLAVVNAWRHSGDVATLPREIRSRREDRDRPITPSEAVVYERKGRLFLSASAETVDGIVLESHPLVDLGDQPGERILGTMLDAVLKCGVTGLGTPGRDEYPAPALPRLAGTKSYTEFMSGTRSVTVTREWDEVTLTPMHNAGPRSGFEFLQEHRQVLNAPDPLKLAQALREALRHAD